MGTPEERHAGTRADGSADSREFIEAVARDPALQTMFGRVMDGEIEHGERGWNPDIVRYVTEVHRIGPQIMDDVLLMSAELTWQQRQEQTHGEA